VLRVTLHTWEAITSFASYRQLSHLVCVRVCMCVLVCVQSRQQTADSRKRKGDSRQQTADSRQKVADRKQQTTDRTGDGARQGFTRVLDAHRVYSVTLILCATMVLQWLYNNVAIVPQRCQSGITKDDFFVFFLFFLLGYSGVTVLLT
jgi:hypothetical protein